MWRKPGPEEAAEKGLISKDLAQWTSAGAKALLILLACPAGDLLYISDRAPGLHIGPCFEVLLFMLVVIGAGGNLGISILRFPDFHRP
jgi:hypothetical protein